MFGTSDAPLASSCTRPSAVAGLAFLHLVLCSQVGVTNKVPHHPKVVLRVARAGLFCTMNYSTKYCSDCLELAKDPPAIEVIYLHKYFQIFIYFI